MKRIWLFLVLLIFSSIIPSVSAEDTGNSFDFSLQNDPELASLMLKYEALLGQRQLSPEEVVELITSDRSEKSRMIGVRVIESSVPSKHDAQLLGLCVRPIWGPGKVMWNFPDPGKNGARYSVLPENASSLIWANPPEQDIDGIYRAGWGSCVAYKIPDSATEIFHTADSWEVCYNAVACAAGNCPRWVNPCDNNSTEGSWPDDPLR